ncbi:GntR family transcriptional regulator [Streptacidiphilus sp. 4-A2]|nr:GntR family transcriptional regulator [Streptacidiphilus sp. 4-A2]
MQERRSLREDIAHALRAALVTGGLRPGIVYSAPALAAEFGVSATPVREAMLDLAKEGLVEVVRNKGFRIIGLTEQDLDDFTEIRALIEVPATVQAARRADPAALEPLRPVAREIVVAANAGDLIGYVEADRRFHLGLLAFTGNRHLVETVRDLRTRSRLYGLNHLVQAGLLVSSAEEHERLLDLMIARDLTGVERAISVHLCALAVGGSRAVTREPPAGGCLTRPAAVPSTPRSRPAAGQRGGHQPGPVLGDHQVVLHPDADAAQFRRQGQVVGLEVDPGFDGQHLPGARRRRSPRSGPGAVVDVQAEHVPAAAQGVAAVAAVVGAQRLFHGAGRAGPTRRAPRRSPASRPGGSHGTGRRDAARRCPPAAPRGRVGRRRAGPESGRVRVMSAV